MIILILIKIMYMNPYTIYYDINCLNKILNKLFDIIKF